jgi:hypothetical protein
VRHGSRGLCRFRSPIAISRRAEFNRVRWSGCEGIPVSLIVVCSTSAKKIVAFQRKQSYACVLVGINWKFTVVMFVDFLPRLGPFF